MTDANKGDINPSGKTAGKIMYDSGSKTLHVNNVTMSSEKACIDVEGNVCGIFIYGNGSAATIQGDLLVKATGNKRGIGSNNEGRNRETLVIGGLPHGIYILNGKKVIK